MNIKLIASDLDGTLLLNGSQRCEDSLFPVLQKLLDRGIYFVPASGRQYGSLMKLFAPVKDRLAYICENGALVMYRDQVIAKSIFEDSLAMALCHAIIDRPECEVLISGERTCYVVPKSREYVRHLREDVRNDVTVIAAPEQIREPIIKISFYVHQTEKLPDAKKRLGAAFAGEADMMVSGNEWIDFAPKGTGKGSALMALGEALGVGPEEMAAFGDNDNDRSMLELVGYPFVMQNANPKIADIQAPRCESVEEVLKSFASKV